MKRAISRVVFTDLVFLLMLTLCGTVENRVISDILYYAAFLIPAGLGLAFISRARAEMREDDKPDAEISFGLRSGELLRLAPLLLPSVTLIFLLSYLTSLGLGAMGFVQDTSIEEPFLLAIVIHALLPALLEEGLFRYIPMKLLLPYSKKWTVILSALFFALIHTNLFQLPYAFAAGVIFLLLDISFGSIIPSVILHFINNLLSLVMTFYVSEGIPAAIFFSSMALLSLISLSVALMRRKHYRDILSPFCEKGRQELGYSPLLLLLLTLLIAATRLF